jgi:hypothetical protein
MSTATRIVRISAHKTGVNFGHVAVISARNGRDLWTGPVFGSREAALTAASDKARREGWAVAGV